MTTLGQEMKTLRSELEENRVNAIEIHPRALDPTLKGRQTATRFCNYSRTYGHTSSWCRKKLRDEELRRTQNERTAEEHVTLTQDYNKKRGPDHGLEAKISKGGTRITLQMDSGEIPPIPIRVSLRGQTSHIGTNIRIMEDHMINAQITHSIETMEIDLELHLSTIIMRTGEIVETFRVLHRLNGETFQKIIYAANQEVINLTNLPTANLTSDLRVVSRRTNKIFHRTKARRNLMWSASPQPMIQLKNYQISAR